MQKKILLQIRQKYPGLMDSCNEYLRAFDDSKYHKVVVYLKGEHDEEIAAQTPADQVYFLEYMDTRLPFIPLRAVWQICKICRQHAVNIVVAHRYKPTYIMTLASFFCRPANLVSVVHIEGQFSTWRRKLFAKFFLNQRVRFIAVSESTRQDILNSGIGTAADRVLSLPNCTSWEQLEGSILPKEEARKKIGVHNGDYLVGNVGRLSPKKDQETLIQAFALFQKMTPNSKLIIVGNGRMEQDLKAKAEQQGLKERVIFTGNIPNAYQIMSAFDLYAQTSVSESFGRVLLEAMIARIPIVATDSGGIREVVGPEIDLQQAGDCEKLAQAMYAAQQLSEQEKKELVERQFLRVKEVFSRDEFAKTLHEFLDAQ